ncbi:MAG TPA: DegT/DnrJ/EryC1/StrS family aminotransferase [Candidatus Paceibacterota bacterium]
MKISYAHATFGDEERNAVQKALRTSWIVPGKYVRKFEEETAKTFGKKYGVMVNSGSSANFLSLYVTGDAHTEVITPALTLGGVVFPIWQARMKTRLLDAELDTLQIDVDAVAGVLKKNPRQKRILLIPALMGNLPSLDELRQLSKKYRVPFILDSCDTTGATWRGKPIGVYADIVTTSFYGSHIITAAGGGGMAMCDNQKTYERLLVLRNWGRSSVLHKESEGLQDRFSSKIDGIPYDSKFIFLEKGFNFQPIEVQGAFGLVQLRKLKHFMERRIFNFTRLYEYFEEKDFFLVPRQYPEAYTSWLAYPVIFAPNCPFSRKELVIFLEQKGIQTRPIFGGNISRQPAFKRKNPAQFKNADYLMKNAFVIGCHQQLGPKHLTYIFKTFDAFLKKYST